MQCAKHLRIVVVLAMQREKDGSRKELEVVKAYTQMAATSSPLLYAIATHSWLTASLGGGPMQ